MVYLRLQNNPWHYNDDLSLYCPRYATITDYRTIHGTSTMVYLSTFQDMPQSQATEQSMALQRWFNSLPSKICNNHRLQNNPWHSNDGLSLYCPRYATITDYRTIHGTSTMVYLSTVQDMQQSQTTEQSMALQRWFISLPSKICNNHRLQNNPWHSNDGLSLYCPRYATITAYRTIHGTPTMVYLSTVQDMQQSQPTEQSLALQRWFISDYRTIHGTSTMVYLSTVQDMQQSQTTEQSMTLQR